MRAWTQASHRLADSVRWLVRAEAARLLVVVTNAAWRRSALDVIALAEHEEDNLRPFVWLETDWVGGGKWDERTKELDEETEALRTALSEADLELGVRPTASGSGKGSPEQRFVRALCRLAEGIPEPLEGLVAILAPLAREDDPGFAAALRAFVTDERNKRIRWVLVEERSDPLVAVLSRELAERAIVVAAFPDPSTLDEDVDDTLHALSLGHGAAGPGHILPPPIPVWDEPEDPTEASQGGMPAPPAARAISVATEPTLQERLQRLIAGAVLAMRQQRPLDAVRQQREARDLMFLHGTATEGIRMEIMLASYMVGAGFRREACELLAQSAERATEAELPLLLAQVDLARGALLMSTKDDARAAAVFAEAGRAAEAATERTMAIEAYRLSGESAVRAGLTDKAVEAWQRAVIVAGDQPDQPAEDTADVSALAARLARACDKQGLSAQAESLKAQAQILAGFAAAGVEPPREAPQASPPVDATPTPGPVTPAFREVRPEDLPRNKVPTELKRTLPLDDAGDDVAGRPRGGG